MPNNVEEANPEVYSREKVEKRVEAERTTELAEKKPTAEVAEDTEKSVVASAVEQVEAFEAAGVKMPEEITEAAQRVGAEPGETAEEIGAAAQAEKGLEEEARAAREKVVGTVRPPVAEVAPAKSEEAEKPRFNIGDIVRVERSGGRIDEGWQVQGLDQFGNVAVGKEGLLKVIPANELLELNQPSSKTTAEVKAQDQKVEERGRVEGQKEELDREVGIRGITFLEDLKSSVKILRSNGEVDGGWTVSGMVGENMRVVKKDAQTGRMMEKFVTKDELLMLNENGERSKRKEERDYKAVRKSLIGLAEEGGAAYKVKKDLTRDYFEYRLKENPNLDLERDPACQVAREIIADLDLEELKRQRGERSKLLRREGKEEPELTASKAVLKEVFNDTIRLYEMEGNRQGAEALRKHSRTFEEKGEIPDSALEAVTRRGGRRARAIHARDRISQLQKEFEENSKIAAAA